jgi:YD repeat-containing protein
VVFFLTLSVAAQQPPELERGFKPDLVYQLNGFDTVNLLNGNLNLGVPLGSYSVASDVSYSFVLRYAGNMWGYYWDCPLSGPGDPNPPPCVLTWYPINENGGLGWQLSFGGLEFTHSLYGSQLPAGGSLKYVSPDGGEHNFYETLHEPKCPAGVTSSNTCDPVTTGVFYTRDGSYLRLRNVGSDKVIEFPDGQRMYFEATSGWTWRLKYIYSATSTLNGNGYPTTKWVQFEYVSKNLPDQPWLTDTKVTDSHGRTHWIIFHDADPYLAQIDKVQIAAASPATIAEYNLTYGNYTLDGSGNPVNGGLVSIPKPCYAENLMPVPLLSRIDLPHGEKWEFVHETSLTNCTSPGTLTRAAMPTGGNVGWTYQAYPFSTPDGITAAVGVKERCLRRDTSPCSLTASPLNQEQYSKYVQSGSAVTVESYALNSTNTAWGLDTKAVNYFTSAYGPLMGLPLAAETDGTTMARNLSSQIFDCNPDTGNCSAAPERKQYVKYEMDATAACDLIFPCGRDRNRRVVSERTLFVEDGDRYADTDRSIFDGLGHYRETITRGFDASHPQHESFIGFNNNTLGWSAWSGSTVGIYQLTSAGARVAGFTMLNPTDTWILGTYVTAYTRENGSTSHSEACFSPTTGFMHRMRSKGHSTGGNLTTDLLRVYARDADTGYVAHEEYFGGDAPGLAQDIPSNPLCTLTPPAHDQYSFKINHTYQYGVLKTSQFDGMTWKSVENSIIDSNTGLVLQSKDSAGFATGYQYDKQRRLMLVSPPSVSSTSYTYVPVSGMVPARVEALTGSGTARTEQKWEFDPFGRVSAEIRLMPPGIWSVRKTTYNHLGQRASISEWENETGATYANKTTFSNFDPFGRVGLITTPDSKTTSFVYAGERVTTRSYEVAKPNADANVSIEERRDRSGRLIQVIEDSGAGGIAAKTDYTYDEGNRLATVKMWDGAASQPLRVFSYDLRGFLTSETHPESGTTSYTYDARGNAITRVTPENSLTNTYDDAGRMLNMSEDGVGLLKVFGYETATGRLQTATRHNRSTDLGEVTVTETYQYGGLGGRMSRKDTTVQRLSGETAQFYDQYTYNSMGDLASLTYPVCASGTCMSLSAPSRVVSPTYRYGLVSDVAPYTQGFQNSTGITYYPNGLLDTIEHKNVNGSAGPRLKQTIASNRMARVDSISVSNFCDNLSVTAPAPQPKSVPYDTSAGLSVTATGATSHQWYRVDSAGNHVFLSGQTGSTLTALVTETSVYFVRVGNGSCTVDSERGTVTLQVCSTPDATITAPSSMTASTTTTASVPLISGAMYAWSISGGTILSGQGSQQIAFRALCSGTVNLTATVTSAGCQGSDTHIVAVNAPTVGMSVVGPSTIPQNSSAEIRLTFSGTNPWSVTWSDTPGSPQTYGSSPFTRTVFPGVTTASYSVTATDGYGCAMLISGAPVTITVKPPTPTNVVATAITTNQVNVTWSFSGNADRFDVYRAGVLIGNTAPSVFSFNDGGAAPSAAYVYAVRAVKASTPSDPSIGDLATTVIFVDEPTVSFTTSIKAQHITQLQAAVNAVRAAAGLGPQSFATITPGVTIVSASHVESLRTALAPARAALGLPAIGYSRAPLTSGMVVLAADMNETRGGVK